MGSPLIFIVQLLKTLRTLRLPVASFAVRITAEYAEIKSQSAQREEKLGDYGY